MNFKKMLAAFAASAVAVSAMAVNAFAIKNYPDGYMLDLIADGYSVTDVYGFTFNISGDIDSGTGGGVGFNSASTGWESHEWGNADANKELNGSGGSVTIVKDSPVFKESDVTDPSNPYAQIWMQQWWGTDITIDSVVVLGAGGVELSPAGADEAAPEETEAAAEETAAPEETEAAPEEAEEVVEELEEDAEEVVEEVEEVVEVVVDDAFVDDEIQGDIMLISADEPVAVETAAPVVVEEAPAPVADSNTAPVKTGNTAAAALAGIMAVAGAAAVVSKRK